MGYMREITLKPTDLFCLGQGVCAYLTDLKQFISNRANFLDGSFNSNKSVSFQNLDKQCGKIINVLERLTLDTEYLKLLLPNGELYVKDGSKTLIDPQAMKNLLIEVWYLSLDWDSSYRNSDLPSNHYYSDFDPKCELPLAIISFLNSFPDLVSQVDKNIICDDMELTNITVLLEKYHYGMTLKTTELSNNSYLVDSFKRFSHCEILKAKHFSNTHSPQSIELVKLGNKALKTSKPLALSYYSQALVFSPNDPIILSNRAAMFQELESHDEAIKDLKKCITLRKDFSVAYARLAFSYLFLGNAYDSIKCYVNAIRACQGLIIPNNIDVQTPSSIEEYKRNIKSKTLPSYLNALVRSLKLAEERALQQGLSQEVIFSLSSDIESIILSAQRTSDDSLNRRLFRNIPFPMGQGSVISFDLTGDNGASRRASPINVREIIPRSGAALNIRNGDTLTPAASSADTNSNETQRSTGSQQPTNANITGQEISNPIAVVLEGLLASNNTPFSSEIARAITNTLTQSQPEVFGTTARGDSNSNHVNMPNSSEAPPPSHTNTTENNNNNNNSNDNSANTSGNQTRNTTTPGSSATNGNDSSGEFQGTGAGNQMPNSSASTPQSQANPVSNFLERMLTSSGSPLSPELGRVLSRTLSNGQLPDGAAIITAITENGGPMRIFNLNGQTGNHENNGNNSNAAGNEHINNSSSESANASNTANSTNNDNNTNNVYNDTSHLEDINDIE